jgi:uncharacterized repeat protein (TIGR02543 family)
MAKKSNMMILTALLTVYMLLGVVPVLPGLGLQKAYAAGTAPSWVAPYPEKGTMGDTSGTMLVETNETGKVFYVVLPNGSPAPLASEVASGTGHNGALPVTSGSVTVAANTLVTINLTGLSSDSVYNVYLVAEDTSSDLQASPAEVNVSTDVLAYYDFDNVSGGTVPDLSGNGNNATVNGGVTFVSGYGGHQAASFDGSTGYISLPNSLITSNPNFTVILRFKANPSQYGGLLGYQDMSVGEETAPYVPILSIREDGTLYAELWVGGASSSQGGNGYSMTVESTATVNDGQWHKVALSASTNSISLYLDNNYIGGNSVGGITNYFNLPLNQLGAADTEGRIDQPNGWSYFPGLLDDFYLINNGMSSSQIQQLSSSLQLGNAVIPEASANDGSITATQVVTLQNGTFTGTNGQSLSGVTVNNLPPGLTATAVQDSDTQLTISFSGKATNNTSANDVNDASVTIAQADVSGATGNVTSGSFSFKFYNGVSYNANGATGGNVPTESNVYDQGDSVTVLDNSGNLVKAGYTFAGWNTQADGNGTNYSPSDTFAMGNSNIVLYAMWKPLSLPPGTSTLTANADGSISGSQVVTLTNSTFTGTTGQTLAGVTVNNLPAGLTATATQTDSTHLTLTFSGTAANHSSANDVANLSVTVPAADITGAGSSVTSGSFGINFPSPPTAAVAITSPAGTTALDEAQLKSDAGQYTLTLTLGNETWASSTSSSPTLDLSGFSLNNAPPGLSIASVNYVDASHATLTLADVGTNFDTPYDNLSVTISSSQLPSPSSLTTNTLEVTCETKPVVSTTTPAIENSGTDFTTGGNISSDGGLSVTDRGIVYSTQQNPVIGASGVTQLKPSVTTGSGTYTVDLNNLTPGTTYYVRAYATNGEGTAYGGQDTLVTPSNNADLSGLNLSEVVLSPAFAAATTTYTGTVDNTVSSLTLTPTLADENASLSLAVNGSIPSGGANLTNGQASAAIPLQVGANTIAVTVTAADGSTQKTYTVTVTRKGSTDATLGSLNLNPGNGTLSPVFSGSVLAYTATVPNGTTTVQVTAAPEDSNATMTINGTAVTGGSAQSVTISGSNVITIVVTAQDGTTTKTYTVRVLQENYLSFQYPDFSQNTGDLQINRNASIVNGNILQLTPNKTYQAGSAFYKKEYSLVNDRSFSTYFSFKLSGQGGIGQADGIVFALQTVANTAGSAGGGLGFAGLNPAVGVEFDTWHNSENNDPPSPHIGIDINGSVKSAATALTPWNIRNGDVYYAWIDYNGPSKTIEVRLNTTADRPADPVLTYNNLDLNSILNQSEVYVGFTGATGGASQEQDILSWYFNNDDTAINTQAYSYTQTPTTVNLSLTPTDGTDSQYTVTAKALDQNGNPVSGIPITFSSTRGDLSSPSGTTDSQGQATVTLTASQSSGPVTVKAVAEGGAWDSQPESGQPSVNLNLTDQQAVDTDQANLAIGYAPGDSASSVTQNITLPASGSNGTTVTWKVTAGSAISINGTTGEVTRPDYFSGDTQVTLTATISKGTATPAEQTFTLNIKHLPYTAPSVTATPSSGGIQEAPANDGSVTGSVTVSISGGTFNPSISAADITVNNLPAGLTPILPDYASSTTLSSITISFSGNALHNDAVDSTSNASITIAQSMLKGSLSSLTTNSFPITFMDPARITLTNSEVDESSATNYTTGKFTDSLGNAETIEVQLSNGTFKDPSGGNFSSSDFSVSNVPSGLTTQMTYVDATHADLSFSGAAAANDVINDVFDAAVTIQPSAYTGGSSELTSNTFSFIFNEPQPTLSVETPVLTESSANDGSISQTLTLNINHGIIIPGTTVTPSAITAVNLPQGLYIASVSQSTNTDTTGSALTLTFGGKAAHNLASDSVSNVQIVLDGSVVKPNGTTWPDPYGAPIPSNTFAIQFIDPPPSITAGSSVISENDTLKDGSISQTQTVTLQYGTFASDMSGGVTVTNLPQGITASVTTSSATTLTIQFSGKAFSQNPNSADASVVISASKVFTPDGSNAASDLVSNPFNIEDPTDALLADWDSQALNIVYAPGDSADSITQNVGLPLQGANGSTITWTATRVSNNTTQAAITIDNTTGAGIVLRPDFLEGDATVNLTATVKNGTASTTVPFNGLIVKALPMTDTDAVTQDAQNLTLGFSAGDNTNNNNTVTQNLFLPPSGSDGSTITWTSSDPGVISSDGTVTQPPYGSADVSVTLSAIITKNGMTQTKTFTVTVLPSAISGISLSPSPLNLTVGTGGNITATVEPTTAGAITFNAFVGDPSIAAVTQNTTTGSSVSFNIIPLNPGSTTFTVYDAGNPNITTSCAITVNSTSPAAIKISGLPLNPTSISLTPGGPSETFSAEITPSDASNPVITWISSDPDVVTVNPMSTTTNGAITFTLTPVAQGTATITGKAQDGSGLTAVCAVTVSSIPVAPTINSGPAAQTINAGQNAAFSVSAFGTGTLSYQWEKDGSALTDGTLSDGSSISGSETAYLTISKAQTAEAGSYSVVVSSSTGNSVTSSAVTLTINSAPVITVQPVAQSIVSGKNATFSVTVSGTDPISYQWQKNGSNLSDGGNISGSTTATLTISNPQATDAGSYSVIVINNVGSTESNAVSLTVNSLPSIETQPSAQTVNTGQSASFSVAVTGGTPPYSYQWKKGSTTINGANGATLTINNAQTADAGSYSVVITDSAGNSVTSNTVTLTVNSLPSIEAQPTAQTVNTGQKASFSVVATGGTPPYSYQWEKGSTTISGATGATLTINNAQTADAGSYSVVITDSAGNSVTSTPATLTVNTPPSTAQYTVTFDSNGGSAIASVTGVAAGTTITAPTAPTQSGKTFAGWYTDSTLNTLWNFATNKVNGNLTLYAGWITQSAPSANLIESTVYQGNANTIPHAVAVDANGNIYIAGTNGITKLNANGQVIATLGSGFKDPEAITVDSQGNIYVADTGNNVLKKIDPTGQTITTLGTGFNAPAGIAVDSQGNIYVADTGNNAIKKMDPTGQTITTLGTGFNAPTGIAVDSQGNIYVADTGNNAIKKMDPTGNTITTLGAGFNAPTSVALDSSGNIYVTDSGNHAIKEMNAGGQTITTLSSSFSAPAGLAVSGSGSVYVADPGSTAVKSLSQEYTITFDTNGGSSVAPEEVLAGQIAAFPSTAPTKNGYLLAGWYSDAGLTMPYSFTAPVNADLTLYAQWSPAYPAISPTVATFDKNSANTANGYYADIPVTLTLNGSSLNSIQNSSQASSQSSNTTLIDGTDYTVTSSGSTETVILSKNYLSTLPLGTSYLTFTFSDKTRQNIAITVSNSTALISPASAAFDLNSANTAPGHYANISVNLNLNGSMLTSIQNGSTVLNAGTDYTLSGSTVTINTTYLSTLPVGVANLTFTFSGSASANLTVNIIDSKSAPTLNSSAKPLPSAIAGMPTTQGSSIYSLLYNYVGDHSLGIALYGSTSDSDGTWQYSKDSVIWNPLPSNLTEQKALLLQSTDSLRFQVSTGFTGSANPTLTFLAWDPSIGGTADTTQDVSQNGGTTPYSSSSASSVDIPIQINTVTNISVPVVVGSSTSSTTTSAAQVPVTRQTLTNQQSWDSITLDSSQAATAVSTAKNSGDNFIQVEDPGADLGTVAQVQLTVPDTVVSSVTSAALGLNLTSTVGGVQIPAATLQAASPSGTNLVATVTPVTDPVQTSQIQGAVFTAVQSAAGVGSESNSAAVGQSVNIETNLNVSATHTVQVLVPLIGLTQPPADSSHFSQWEQSLGVYIQHSNGSTEYLTVKDGQCTLEYDSSRNPWALMVSVSSFSIFTPFTSYVPVSSISVTPTTLSLTAGGSAGILTASLNPSNASNQSVTWTSSNPSVATVSGSGLTATVTPISAGSTTITVTSEDSGSNASCSVTVNTSGGGTSGGGTVSPPPAETPAPTLPATAQAGTQPGTTQISATPAGGDHLVVIVSSSPIATPNVGDNAPSGSNVIDPYTGGTNIPGVDATTNKYVGVYEVDANNHVVAFQQITLSNSSIAPSASTPAPALTATAQAGTQPGTTQISATPNSGDHLVVIVSSSPITTPNVGDNAPSGSSVIDPYTSGTNIPGVDATTNKYVGVYEVDSNNHVTAFQQITLTDSTVAPIKVNGITITPSVLNLTWEGAPGTLTAVLSPSNATNQTVTWTTDNPLLLSMNSQGLTATVTPMGTGTATVTVTSQDTGVSAHATVIVTALNNNNNGNHGNGGSGTTGGNGGGSTTGTTTGGSGGDGSTTGTTTGGSGGGSTTGTITGGGSGGGSASRTITGGSSSAGGTANNAPTVTGKVVNTTNGQTITSLPATLTTDSNGNITLTLNASQAVTLKQPNGQTAAMVSDLGNLTLNPTSGTAAETPISVNSDGTFQVPDLVKGTQTTLNITYHFSNGQSITLGTLNIQMDANGNVSLTSSLIDPYGVLTDEATGAPVSGGKLILYYANTPGNIAAGLTPGAAVKLPSVAGFSPNGNANPQISDATGEYGFLVFPNTDYYVTVSKDGYLPYTSPTIKVGQDLVNWNVTLHSLGTDRLAGTDRVDTSLAIAKATYPNQVQAVVLATAENYPDALTGSVLAYQKNAPILLVGNNEADQAKILTYLQNSLTPDGTVYILGGTGAVAQSVEDTLKNNGFNTIERIGGINRYATAVDIAQTLGVKPGTLVVIASGENYPDALSVSSAAAVNQYPILLAAQNSIPANVAKEIAAIKPSKIYIIGRQGALSTAVETEAAQAAGLSMADVIRIGGIDRYATSLDVAKYFNLGDNLVTVATGNNFPDALSGSVYAARHQAPILLTNASLLPNEQTWLETKKPAAITVFGGEGAVSQAVQEQLSQVTGQ